MVMGCKPGTDVDGDGTSGRARGKGSGGDAEHGFRRPVRARARKPA